MKRLFFLTTLLAVLSLSCNKSHNPGSAYYIKATIDGVNKSFSGTFATRTADTKTNTININGLFTSAGGEGLDVLVSTGNPNLPVDTATYGDTSSVYTILVTYAPSAVQTGYSAGTAISDSAKSHGITIVNHLKVVISAINNAEVQGSFSGDLFLGGDASADKKTVTDGTFYAKFQ